MSDVSMSHRGAPSAGSPPQRLAWADAAKGVLIVLVVFWHVVLKTYLQVDWRIGVPIPGVWGTASDAIWPFLMPLFLLVSGYFASHALSRPWAVVLRPRVIRFAYLYLLWTLIHMAAMWAFPDFPTFVPRGVAEFVEAVTISPPNTWYLYALALYFLVAKGVRRLPRWAPIVSSAILSIVVSAGLIDVVSNRGSLLYNLLFFLLGCLFAPQIGRFAARPRPGIAATLVAGYVVAFVLMRATGSEQVPGVWPVVSLLGVAMGLSIAPLWAAAPLLGRATVWLGRRTLVIYLIHMPVLAVIDVGIVPIVSDAGNVVQLAAAIALPVVLTAVVVAVSVLLGQLTDRDGLTWLWDLPVRPTRRRSSSSDAAGRRVPWRTPIAVLLLTGIGVVSAGATAIPGPPAEMPRVPAARSGEVSIGAVGDILLHDVNHRTPDDRGRGYFDAVRPWFVEDIVTGNLEQAITADTGYDKCGRISNCLAFRSDPDAARHLRGFDILNQANNHSHDFGLEGFDATRAHLRDMGVRTVGKRNEIAYTRVGDVTVAMVGFAPYRSFNRVTDVRHVRQIVRAAAANADVVVIHAHMGAEGPDAHAVTPGTESMFGENRGDPLRFAHTAIDAGADLVIGHGPHVLRGMEFYQGRLIAYSLGNFGGGGVFGAEQDTRYGAYLSVALRPDGTIADARVRSVTFTFDGGEPTPDPDDRAVTLMNERSSRDFPDSPALIDRDGVVILPEPAR